MTYKNGILITEEDEQEVRDLISIERLDNEEKYESEKETNIKDYYFFVGRLNEEIDNDADQFIIRDCMRNVIDAANYLVEQLKNSQLKK